MNLDYNAITAGAAVVTALIAVYAVMSETRRSRFSQGIDLIQKMSDEFVEPGFQKHRSAAARFLLQSASSPEGTQELANQNAFERPTSLPLDEVLDFFQFMAVLARKGVIDKELTWNSFFYWLDCYYTLAWDYIVFWRQSSPSVWDDIDWLHRQLIGIEKKHNPQSYHSPTPEMLSVFLSDEAELGIA